MRPLTTAAPMSSAMPIAGYRRGRPVLDALAGNTGPTGMP